MKRKSPPNLCLAAAEYSPMPVTSLVWFRIDLRLADNPALQAAIEARRAVVPVFIHAPEEEAPWSPGGASLWWLHQSLASLDASLARSSARDSSSVAGRRSKRCTRWPRKPARRQCSGIAATNLPSSRATRKSRIHCARGGLEAESFNAALLHEPWTIQNQSGKPFQVFTPFWKHCLTKPDPAEPLPAPNEISAPGKWPKSLALDALELEPKIQWAEGMRAAWQPGEAGAQAQLERFLKAAVRELLRTTAIAPISPARRGSRRICTSAKSVRAKSGTHCARGGGGRARRPAAPVFDGRTTRWRWRTSQFLAEVGWREFAHHLLFHFPHTPTEPLRADFKKFPWRKDAAFLKAWQKGRTGYPIVDAGMRELWTTGWMHNRVRMIVASFLVKDLLISWHGGRALVLGHAGGRRPRAEHARLAMDGGLRRGCRALLPRVQSDEPGRKV